MPDAQTTDEADDDDVPCAPMFATETMAELSARQGRLPDAIAIYRHLIREAEAGGEGVPADRVARWKARLVELEQGGGGVAAPPGPRARQPAAPTPAADVVVELVADLPLELALDLPTEPPAAPVVVPPPPPPRRLRPSLIIREPVRSGQVIYADGRDLIVIASVNPGSQLLADGNIHVYGALKGRAVAGAQGLRDAQVFCLALDPELVGVDTGYLLSDDIPDALRGAAARIFLTDAGTCAVVPLVPALKPAATAAPPARGRGRY